MKVGMNPMWVAIAILLVTYAAIISEKLNRAVVALVGAGAVIVDRSPPEEFPFDRVIPTCIDQNPCAQSRSPMDMMRQGCSTSLFQAAQQ